MKTLIVLLTFILSITTAQAQQYCGYDKVANHTPKITLVNYALYTEQFELSNWTKSNLTSTANTVVAPDGTLTGDTITLTSLAGSSARYLYATAVVSIGNQSSRREGIHLKKGTHAYARIYSQYPSTASTDVNLNDCSILRTGATNTTSFSIAVTNGWCLVGFTHTPTNNNALPTIEPLKDASSPTGTSWTSTGAETFYVWGSQVNLAADDPTYVKTTTKAVYTGPICLVGTYESALDPTKCFPIARKGTDYILGGLFN